MFLSFKDTWTPTKLSLVRVGVKILLAWVLVGPLAHIGLALAESFSHIVRTLCMFFFLPEQIRGKEEWKTVKSLLGITSYGALTFWSNGEEVQALLKAFTVLGTKYLPQKTQST
jgi:peptidoglycan biosynthesis protein MviN/MurJ (putative lipid II flippase)